jgi:hypothetical protein
VRLQREVDEALEGHVPHEVHHAAVETKPARQKRKLDSKTNLNQMFIIEYLSDHFNCYKQSEGNSSLTTHFSMPIMVLQYFHSKACLELELIYFNFNFLNVNLNVFHLMIITN